MKFHIVRDGETIRDIMFLYSVTEDELKEDNRHIRVWDRLIPGTKLKITPITITDDEDITQMEPFIEDYYPKDINIEKEENQKIIEEDIEEILIKETKEEVVKPEIKEEEVVVKEDPIKEERIEENNQEKEEPIKYYNDSKNRVKSQRVIYYPYYVYYPVFPQVNYNYYKKRRS